MRLHMDTAWLPQHEVHAAATLLTHASAYSYDCSRNMARCATVVQGIHLLSWGSRLEFRAHLSYAVILAGIHLLLSFQALHFSLTQIM